MQAFGHVMALREAAVFACQPFDSVVSPVSPILPYAAELAAPNNDPHDALAHIAFTVPYNMERSIICSAKAAKSKNPPNTEQQQWTSARASAT